MTTKPNNPPAFGEWQPIETAPRDGTKILVYEPKLKSLEFAWWGQDHNAEDYQGWLCGDGDDWSYGYYYTPINPICWMPLPNPPASEASDE